MSTDLVFITCNRLEYTKLALASVLADPTEDFSLTIWDNGSTDGTAEYLRDEVSDARIADIVLSKNNVGQITAVNEVWGKSRADLVGKLDNDCLVTAGWTRVLGRAHADIERLGVVACWHFFPEDFDYELARHKIQRFGEHRILRHPWTGGAGLLVKTETYRRLGPIGKNATTSYWIHMAAAGYINGFYYPLVYQEHMDDPRSRHTLLRDAESLEKYLPVSARNFGVRTVEQWVDFLKKDARRLQRSSGNARSYMGWRRKFKQLVTALW
jgi:glycosyltransferase involved in cell wall biosynthesis